MLSISRAITGIPKTKLPLQLVKLPHLVMVELTLRCSRLNLPKDFWRSLVFQRHFEVRDQLHIFEDPHIGAFAKHDQFTPIVAAN